MTSKLEDKFLKLKTSEVILKLKGFVKDKSTAKIWIGKNLSIYRVCEINEKSPRNIELVFFSEAEDDALFMEKEVCFNFSAHNVDYFGKAKFRSVENDKISIVLKEDIFRLEKRDNERVLTYPRYKSFFCIKGEKEHKSLDNVVFLNKKQEKKVQKEVSKDHLINEKIHSLLLQKVENPEDYTNFRILDLSESGMSVLINAQDKDKIGDNHDCAIVTFEKELFFVENIEIIYDVPYISNDLNHQMVKVGIQFDFNEKIKTKADLLLGENWENFIDAESIEKLLDT